MVKKVSMILMMLALLSIPVFGNGVSASTSDYSRGVDVSGSTATIWFKSNVNTTWVDVHYSVNSGAQQNLRMTYNSSTARYEQNVKVSTGDVITYSFTYNNGTPAYNTPSYTYTVGSGSAIVSGAVYKLINTSSGKALDVDSSGTSNYTNVQIYTDNGSGAQKWRIISNNDGSYKLINTNSGKALDVYASGTDNYTNVDIYTDNGTGAQKWRIISNNDGSYKLINPNSGKALDVYAAGTTDGTNVDIYTDNGTGAQKWKLVKLSGESTPPSGGGGSINSIPVSSMPAPSGDGVMTFKIMNGTNGKYSDNQIYWAVLGINPANGQWSYLDLGGHLQPISNALNNASGHLTKNGQNYANIYHKISDASWASLPQITSGRMYFCVGSPCYIKTYDNGFAGPDINNPSDPNRDVYFDFIEFTVNNTGFHGNTTRVDMFGFPLELRLADQSGSYDRTVGEPESETRAGLFNEFKNEVPAAFQSLATVQAPYRIVAPIHGSFAAGGINAHYFDGYSPYNTQDILRCDGAVTDAQTCAAINRHVYNNSNWSNVSRYYQAAPANYYAKFWHDHNIDHLAYGFAYDDVNGRASYLEIGSPKGMIVRVGW